MPGRSVLAVLLVAASALLLAACGAGGSASGGDHGGHAGAESVAAPVEGASEITVTAVDLDFEPTSIEAVAGEPLNVTVANEGEVLHDFTLDAADVHVNVEPGESTTTSLTLDEPGTYQATCTVPGHAEAGMVMDVVVK